MNKKYRWLIVLLVLVVCAIAGCRKQQETLLLYEDAQFGEDTVKSGVMEQSIDDGAQENAEPTMGRDPETVSGDPEQSAGNGTGVQSDEAAVCVVHVCGAVQNPGVYSLAEGSRIYEAVAAAGGLLTEADEAYLNQAACVTDGEQIYVPTKQEVLEQSATLARNGLQTEIGTGLQDTKVNLNTATKEQLCTLPGIGESKAESIISYRNEHGAYGQIEDIMKVEGIKDGLFQKIKDRITV